MQMIARDAAVIGHKSPRPRIEIGRPDPKPSDPNAMAEAMRAEMWQFQRWAEADRIWRLVVEASR